MELDYVLRGRVLCRRINSERIAIDPRIAALLALDPTQLNGCFDLFPSISPLQINILTPSSTHPVVTQTERVSDNTPGLNVASFFQSIGQTLCQLTHDDVLMRLTDRITTLSPASMCVLLKKLTVAGGTATSAHNPNWWEQERLVRLLNETIMAQFTATGKQVCVFDAGLVDSLTKTYGDKGAALFDAEFAGGRFSALATSYGDVPTLHDLFIAVSTITAWLNCSPDHVVVLLAPTHDRLNVLLAALMMYCSETITDVLPIGTSMANWYTSQVSSYQTLGTLSAKVTKALAPKTGTSSLYTGNAVPSNVTHAIRDFATLLERRDHLVLHSERFFEPSSPTHASITSSSSPSSRPSLTPTSSVTESMLPGHAVLLDTSAGKQLFLTSLTLGVAFDPLTIPALSEGYRPYFVLYNAQGELMFSTMVHGIHTVQLSNGPHTFSVDRSLPPNADFWLKMYHVPLYRQGQLIFQVRLHTSILEGTLGEAEQGTVLLSMASSDFDAVSTRLLPGGDFSVKLALSRNPTTPLPLVTSSASLSSPTNADFDELLTPRRRVAREDEAFASALQRQFAMEAASERALRQRETSPPPPSYVKNEHTGGASIETINQLPVFRYLPREVRGTTQDTAVTSMSEECLICLDEYQADALLKNLPCFHKFHVACIDPWLSRNGVCPICFQRVEM